MTLAPLLTWVYNRTGGSLFLAMLTHASINASIAMAPALPSGPMLVGIVAFGAISLALVVATRGRPGCDARVPLGV